MDQLPAMMQPGFQRKHREQGQGHAAYFLIGQSEPGQEPKSYEHRQRNRKTRQNQSWCTGEDSNLRSSKERQVYSLLPLTARPPVHFPEGSASGGCALASGPRETTRAKRSVVRPKSGREFIAREQDSREHSSASQHCITGSFLWE